MEITGTEPSTQVLGSVLTLLLPATRPPAQGAARGFAGCTAWAQRAEYRTLVAALVAEWEAELPCGVLLALEPTAADARAPHALGAARCERLHAAREAYAQAFAREGLRLEDAAG